MSGLSTHKYVIPVPTCARDASRARRGVLGQYRAHHMRLLSNCHRPQAALQRRRKWPVNSWEAERLAGTGKTTPEADQYRSRDICSAEFRPSIMRSGRRQEHGAAYGVSIWEGREESVRKYSPWQNV
ncbi:hypothetical protein H4582DRAFT_2062409 [Lactarius indigo]|nr:hypothetical protein H4582DRAFT_2062409 [Lactarius indigo]